jgi:hypothetical protein
MDAAVDQGAESVDQSHRGKGRLQAGIAVQTQMPSDDAQQDVQHSADRLRHAR